MKTKNLIALFMFLLSFSFSINLVQAASITISQSGADAGTVMKGRTFTVTVSDLSGSGTVTLVLPSGFSTSEGLTKSFSEGTTSVSWTTVIANQKVSGAQISATISTPDTATSDSFDVVLPPSLSASISPTSVSVDKGSTYTVSISIQNNGETTARFGSIDVSGTGMSVSSGCSPVDIQPSTSSAITCTVTASTAGSYNVYFTITPSNADSVTESISVTVAETSTPSTTPSGTTGAMTGGAPSMTRVTLARGNANITVPSIAAWKMANVTITKTEDIAFRQINISVLNSVNNIKIVITKISRLPTSISHEISGKVYHLIEVLKENISDTDINKVFINFAVNKSWLIENGIDKTNISLYRWENKWRELETNYINEDSSEVFYQAESPGLSYFLIGTKSGEIVTTPTTCTENWQCTEWSACINNQQTRTCTDINNCGTTFNKPIESQSCVTKGEVKAEFVWIYYLIAAVIIIIIAIVIIFRKSIKSLFS